MRARIEEAARAAGRDAAEIRLVAVTKGHPVEALRAALAAGLTDLGENRVDEMSGKVAELGRAAARWHMIGHVQSRKAKDAEALADWVHSVDSLKLAERLGRAATEAGRTLAVLVQVNTSGEAAKEGLTPGEAEDTVLRIAEIVGVRVEGLMTMAPLTDDERVSGATFARLRELHGRIRARSGAVGAELSMGMTNDLALAVREGSTMVRIGTALFGDRR
ncbi:MAG: YggS family pyridoxal phosphate-dependent enzyme [Gemmatimonadetes bacterium]|nr:YggS family pyridoxal phosphate-dependent enzyme [Gemmatimonadota bacterium]